MLDMSIWPVLWNQDTWYQNLKFTSVRRTEYSSCGTAPGGNSDGDIREVNTGRGARTCSTLDPKEHTLIFCPDVHHLDYSSYAYYI